MIWLSNIWYSRKGRVKEGTETAMSVQGKIWAGKQRVPPSTVRLTLVLWKELCAWSHVTKNFQFWKYVIL